MVSIKVIKLKCDKGAFRLSHMFKERGGCMPRNAREKSETGIYHVMLRGIDKRDIFLDDEDKKTFLSHLFKAKELGDFQIYAYCLMDNHVHLLIKEGEELGKSIKRITVGYVQKHNLKYGRTGHLFQNRYKSQVVENDNYVVSLARYIHQNPIKAGLVKNIDTYPWSSFKDYLTTYNNGESKIETEIVKSYFSNFKEFVVKSKLVCKFPSP